MSSIHSPHSHGSWVICAHEAEDGGEKVAPGNEKCLERGDPGNILPHLLHENPEVGRHLTEGPEHEPKNYPNVSLSGPSGVVESHGS